MTAYPALTREQVISVIEGKGQAPRVPILLHFWTYPEAFGERASRVSQMMSHYEQDAQIIGIQMPSIYEGMPDNVEYRWVNYSDPNPETDNPMDERIAIADWSQIDSILNDFPKSTYPGMFPWKPLDDRRYRLGHWWYCFFERHWSLRGMTNALTDFMLFPKETHRFYRALTDFYKQVIVRGANETKLDGILVSDDIGTQKGPFFSPATFREFFKPYYKELIETAHENNMHFWLHTCGNVEAFLEDFIEIGLDVIHPIQKYAMDSKQIADRYGSRICIWAGFDVQQIIPYGTAEEVRQEVRHMMDTYRRPEGRFMLTAGNGITEDTRIDALEALYSEAYTYGIN